MYRKERWNQGVRGHALRWFDQRVTRGHRAKCNGTRGLGGVRGVE